MSEARDIERRYNAARPVQQEITAAEYRALLDKKPSKYRNVKYYAEDGQVFDSLGEHDYWLYLCHRQFDGDIERLERQVSFDLTVNGVKVARYVADYVYFENGRQVVADYKGYETRMSKLKRKLMRACHSIEVQLVWGKAQP